MTCLVSSYCLPLTIETVTIIGCKIVKAWYHCAIHIHSELCLGVHRLFQNYAEACHEQCDIPTKVWGSRNWESLRQMYLAICLLCLKHMNLVYNFGSKNNRCGASYSWLVCSSIFAEKIKLAKEIPFQRFYLVKQCLCDFGALSSPLFNYIKSIASSIVWTITFLNIFEDILIATFSLTYTDPWKDTHHAPFGL